MARQFVCGVLLVLSLTGCNTHAKWTYPLSPSNLYRSPTVGSGGTLAVLPFREARPVKNSAATSLLYLVPLVPYGWVNYERPEAARMFNTIAEYDFQLDEDLAKAAVRSFEEGRLFVRVYFTFGGEPRDADLILRGTARHTTYNGKIYSYGLSAFGPLLWFIGLPSGTSTNWIDITLSLTDKKNHEYWRYSFSGKRSTNQGLYYNWGNDTLQFAGLFQVAMNKALRDLAGKLPEIRKLRDREHSEIQP